MDSTVYGILYHLGVLRFVRGDFNAAADAFRRAQPLAPDAGELAGSTDWLWMSLMRAGRASEATAMLARRPDSLPTTAAYAKRLKMYRGEITPEQLITPADTSDIDVATLAVRARRLVHGARRHGEGAGGVQEIRRVGWLAGVRVHRVGGGAAKTVATLAT